MPSPRLTLWAVIALALVLISGCQRRVVRLEPDPSAWGDVLIMALAEQTFPPAMNATPDRLTMAWIGADGTGVHQDARAIDEGRITPPVVLPLPPKAPRESRLFQAGGSGNNHLLWMDVDGDGMSQLYNALIDESLGIFRGPLQISAEGARCFDALPMTDRSLWAVWYGGAIGEPGLYSAMIERSGLVLRQQRIASGGGCPVLVEKFNAHYALWPGDDGLLHVATLLNGHLIDTRMVASLPTERGVTRSIRGGSDGEYLYFFWNINTADGQAQTWFTAGKPDDSQWPAFRRLTVKPDPAIDFVTTLNTGKTITATEGDNATSAAWASPMRGVTGVLPLAGLIDREFIGMVYMQDGTVAGYQRLVRTRGLLGPMELQMDQDRHLYLAWSEPTEYGSAEMRITSTRQLLR